MVQTKSTKPTKKARIAGVINVFGRKTKTAKNSREIPAETQQRICERAYQFFVERGFEHGHHEEDWLRAEAVILAESRKPSASRQRTRTKSQADAV